MFYSDYCVKAFPRSRRWNIREASNGYGSPTDWSDNQQLSKCETSVNTYIGIIDRSGIAGQCTRGDTSVFVQSCAFVFVRVCNCICTIWAGLGHNKREDESFNTAGPLTSPDQPERWWFWWCIFTMLSMHLYVYKCVSYLSQCPMVSTPPSS